MTRNVCVTDDDDSDTSRKVKKERCRSERYERRLTQRSLCSKANATCPIQSNQTQLLRRDFKTSSILRIIPTKLYESSCSTSDFGVAANRRQTESANQFCAAANFGGAIIFAIFWPVLSPAGGGWPSPRWVSGTLGCCRAGTRCTFSNLFPRCSNAAAAQLVSAALNNPAARKLCLLRCP